MANDVTMEAVFTAAVEEDVDVIINEVFYKSGEDIKPSDWVEIYNAGDATVDLLGWTFSDSQYDSAFVFNTSYVLYPEAYLVICKNTQNFKTCYPWVNNVVGEIRFGLSSLGDNLRLYNAEGLLMDAVDYYPTGEWPLEANGGGASLEVIDPGEANEYADNWMASPNGGTPGEQNTHFVDTGVFTPSKTLEAALRCDPNPIAAKSRVSFSIKKTGYYQLDILNSHGQVVQVLEQQVYSAGSHQLLLNRSGLSRLASGLYLLRLSGAGGMESIRIVIVPNT